MNNYNEIHDEQSYLKAIHRIEELELVVKEDTPTSDPAYKELEQLIDCVDQYEESAYPIPKPTCAEVMKLRMYEMGLNKTQLSKMIGVSVSSLSQYLLGKREPSLSVARQISKKLNIASDIVLGV